MSNKQPYAPLGVFDSGRGGYYTLQCLRAVLAEYDYLFYGDTLHMPYGDKSPEEIKNYTYEGLHRLFDHGCELVIVACNTAAAYAVRSWQIDYPHKKVLSVTIPGIEALVISQATSALFLATSATVKSGILTDLAHKFNYTGTLRMKECPGLADYIEKDVQNLLSDTEKKSLLASYVGESAINIEAIILACTHYGVWYQQFVDLYPHALIIDPSQCAALQTVHYLQRHREINQRLSKKGTLQEFWTW